MALRSTLLFGIALCIPCLAQVRDAAARASEAAAFVAAGKPAEAIPVYRELIRSFPQNPALFLNVSIAEFNASRFQDAIADAKHALELNQSLTAARLFLGASYLKSGQYDPAVKPLRDVIAATPGDLNARLMLGQTLIEVGGDQEALEHFRAVIDSQPASAPAWFGLARASTALARSAAGELQKVAPGSAFALAAAGDEYLEQKRPGYAYEAYRKSLAAGPVLDRVCSGLGKVYRELGHPDWNAPECGSSALPAGDSSTAGLLYTAYVGFRDQAHNAWERLLALPPSLERFLHSAKALDESGAFVSAAAEWRKALEFAPESVEIRTGLAWSLYRGRDYRNALTVVEELLRASPGSATLNFLKGAILLNVQQPGQAIPWLNAALKTDRQLVSAEAALGQALLETGKAESAIPHLIAGLATDEDGTVRYQLLRAYRLTGKTDLARRAIVDYQEFRSAGEKKKLAEAGADIEKP